MTSVLPFRPDEKAVLEPDLLGLGMLDSPDREPTLAPPLYI